MSTYDPPQKPELVVRGRKAAYCTRRLGGAGDLLTVPDMEDLIQAATLAYRKHHREGRPVPFCFVCARQAAEKHSQGRSWDVTPAVPSPRMPPCTTAATLRAKPRATNG